MPQKNAVTAQVVPGSFDEGILRARVEEARAGLAGGRCDLALVFLTPPLMDSAREIVELVQVHARAPLLVGCSGPGVIAGGEEMEEGAAVAFGLMRLPGATLTAVHVRGGDAEDGNGAGGWPRVTGVEPGESRGWLVFADPYSMDAEVWVEQWNEVYPGVPMVGGLAGGHPQSSTSQLFLNQEVHTEGAVAVSIGGRCGMEALVSQGCRPIGRPWTVTSAERNLIRRIGNVPALTVLQDTFEGLPASDKARAGGNIFVGLAMNEYREEHVRGDFLIRNLLAADPQSGAVAVGARVRVGQTVQFQFRDSESAEEDFSGALESVRVRLAGRRVLGACLCSCAGRGARLFGRAHHDVQRLRDGLGAGIPVAGFFCNGEVGPVGGRNYVHGYTASAALFVCDDVT